MIVQRCELAVDRNLVKVGAAQTDELRIRVREQASVQERVIGEINARHDMAEMKGNLLRLREKAYRNSLYSYSPPSISGCDGLIV